MLNALKVVKDQDNPTQRLTAVSRTAITVLGQVCTIKTNRFYIPGETTISERLRKCSFDCGLFTMLYYVVLKLKDTTKEFADFKHQLNEKVL